MIFFIIVFFTYRFAELKRPPMEGPNAFTLFARTKPEDSVAEPEDSVAEPEDSVAEPEDSVAEPEDSVPE